MRVLMVSPTVDATDVGESWVAYQWADHVSRRCDLTLLTYRKRGRPSAREQLPHARVVEWEEPPLLHRAERVNSLLKPGYVPFALRAHRWVRRALASGEQFDVAHQPLPVAARYPSPLTGCGIPYLLGPVGGGLDSPPAFRGDDPAPWWTRLRELDGLRLRHDPLLRRSFQSAACVLGIAPYVGDLLAPLDLHRLEYLPETALEELPPQRLRELPTDGPVRLLHVGRLVRTKGAREAIRAVSALGDLDVRLDVVGDGYDRAACEQLVRSLHLGDRVTLSGALPHAEVMARFAAAHLFVFPSFREPGGNVVFEALGQGLPVVACDRGGPSSVVTDDCGVLVPATDPDQLGRDVAAAVRRLVGDPELYARLSAGAHRRVAEVGLWSRKVDHVAGLYAEIAARG